MRTNGSGRAQVAKGVVLLTLVVGAVALDTYSNVTYGIANGGHLFGGYFLIAAIGLVVLPWGGGAGYARWFALSMTVWASVNTCTSLLGRDMNAKNEIAAKHMQAKADAADLRKKLAAITETGTVADLVKLDAASEAAADSAEARDTAKMGERTCFKPCQDARKVALAMKGRLADARARDALQAKLDEAENKADANPNVEANAVSASIAAWTGVAPDGLTRAFLFVMAGLAIAMITTIATLGQYAIGLIAKGHAAMERADLRVTAKVVPLGAIAVPSPAVVTPPQRGRKGKLEAAEALEILRDIARSTDGRIVGSNATLAALLGVHPNTLCDSKGWLRRWEKQGLVRIESRKRGQKVVVIAAAKAA